MDLQLTGKVALVTGGSVGIGLGIANRLAEDGAQVVIVGRRQSAIDDASGATMAAKTTKNKKRIANRVLVIPIRVATGTPARPRSKPLPPYQFETKVINSSPDVAA